MITSYRQGWKLYVSLKRYSNSDNLNFEGTYTFVAYITYLQLFFTTDKLQRILYLVHNPLKPRLI
jgi:hypothetical protein